MMVNMKRSNLTSRGGRYEGFGAGFFVFLLLVSSLVIAPGLPGQAQDDNASIFSIDGLDGCVEIHRDEWGVPTVRATTNHDLFFGMGWAMAADRLWQMDGSRRLAWGRVAEIAGFDQIHWDIYHRTLGLGKVAEESLDLIDPETLECLQAYADGVNAFIGRNSDNLPFEFLLLDYEPEPWEVVDSLAIARLVALWLAADSWDEETYGDLIDAVGDETAGELFRPVPLEDPDYSPFESSDVTESPQDQEMPGESVPAEFDDGSGNVELATIREAVIEGLLQPLARLSRSGPLQASNIWAVDGSLTGSGEPILAMDPHLNYFSPSILYEVILEGGDFHCWGATFPGMPFLPFGANEHIAWGGSNLPADCQDLFAEKLNPANRTEYEVDGEWVPFETVQEEIAYKSPENVTRYYFHEVYISGHGPVIDEKYGEYLALKWTGLTPSDDVTSFLKAMMAESLEDFYEAFRSYHSPPQNFCCAESGPDGRVGQIIVGDIPIRSGYDGTHPADGTDSSLRWTGFIPYDDLPHRIDPTEGFVAHANNLPLGVLNGDERPFGGSLGSNQRVNRIIELLAERRPLDPGDMRAMQMDDLDSTARFLVPALMQAWGRVGGDYQDIAEYIQAMDEWDYRLTASSVPATFYQLWIIELVQSLIVEHLPYGVSYYILFEDRWLPLLEEYIKGETSLEWLKADTPEDRDRKLIVAFESALERLRTEIGPDPSAWRWGELNRAVFPHPSGFSAFVGGGCHPWGGGRFTLRVGHFALNGDLPFENDFGAVMRSVVSSVGGRWQIESVLPPGESGCAFWPHGSDQMSMWLAGEMRPVPFGAAEIETPCSVILEPE